LKVSAARTLLRFKQYRQRKGVERCRETTGLLNSECLSQKSDEQRNGGSKAKGKGRGPEGEQSGYHDGTVPMEIF